MNKDTITSKSTGIARNFLISLQANLKKTCISICTKLIKCSFWLRILIALAALFSTGLIISLFFLMLDGTLPNLLTTISFAILLFVDLMFLVLFHYNLNTQKGLKFFISEYNAVAKTFSCITEKGSIDAPMFLVLGDKNSGKSTLIKNSDTGLLTPEIKSPSSVKTHFNKNILLWTYHNNPEFETDPTETKESKKKPEPHHETFPQNKTTPNKDFNTFLRFLKTRKNLLNLNGIILTIPAEKLLNCKQSYLSERAKYYSEKINNIQSKLGINIPLYIIITKCDKICGFNEFCQNLDARYYKQTFGWVNLESNIGKNFEQKALDKQVEKIVEQIKKQRLNLLHGFVSEPAKNSSHEASYYFAFPENINNIFSKLKEFVGHLANQVYRTSKLSENKYNLVPLFVRGIWFTSSKQEKNFHDHVYFDATGKETFFQRKSKSKAPEKSLFVKEFFEKVLYHDTTLSVRLTSLRRTYKLKRIYGISLVLGSFIILFFLTSLFWSNVFKEMTMDKANLNTLARRSLHSKLLYPPLSVEISEARNNYLSLEDMFSQFVEDIAKVNRKLVYNSIPPFNLQYSKLNGYAIEPRFSPDYLRKISENWKKIHNIVNSNIKVINKEKILSKYILLKIKYDAYLEQYYSYWMEIINDMSSPLLTPWNELVKNCYQYWQIENNLKTAQKIARKALITYKKCTENNKATPANAASVDRLIKELDEHFADNSLTRNKAIKLMEFWNTLFTAKSPIKARNIIFNTKPGTLYQKAMFKYLRQNEHTDYSQKYWKNLSQMFFTSLKNAITTDATSYIKTLMNEKKFPISTTWQKNNDITISKLKTIQKQLNILWPPENYYLKDYVGNNPDFYDEDFDDLIAGLRPQLTHHLMTKTNRLKKLIKNILPKNNQNNVVKVYLLPSDTQNNESPAADYWTIVKMDQDKITTNKTSPVRTRIDKPVLLGEIPYPINGSTQFDFFKTEKELKTCNPTETLKINGTWRPLRLLFNGPQRPKSWKKKYWITWQRVDQVNDSTWITKISFVNKQLNAISFYIKLVFSTNISSITMN